MTALTRISASDDAAIFPGDLRAEALLEALRRTVEGHDDCPLLVHSLSEAFGEKGARVGILVLMLVRMLHFQGAPPLEGVSGLVQQVKYLTGGVRASALEGVFRILASTVCDSSDLDETAPEGSRAGGAGRILSVQAVAGD
jgi:hypothetical protein